MTPHPIPKYLSRPSLYFLALILLFTLSAPAPFAIISPGPVTDLLSKGIKISGDHELETSGKLYSLTVFVNNPDTRPPGIYVLQAWLDGQEVVLPNEIVYKVGETTKSADRAAKKSMRTSEVKAAIAAANFLKKLNITLGIRDEYHFQYNGEKTSVTFSNIKTKYTIDLTATTYKLMDKYSHLYNSKQIVSKDIYWALTEKKNGNVDYQNFPDFSIRSLDFNSSVLSSELKSFYSTSDEFNGVKQF